MMMRVVKDMCGGLKVHRKEEDWLTLIPPQLTQRHIGGNFSLFLNKRLFVWLELYLMVWFEMKHLHISAITYDRDLKLGTHLRRNNWSIFVRKNIGLNWDFKLGKHLRRNNWSIFVKTNLAWLELLFYTNQLLYSFTLFQQLISSQLYLNIDLLISVFILQY